MDSRHEREAKIRQVGHHRRRIPRLLRRGADHRSAHGGTQRDDPVAGGSTLPMRDSAQAVCRGDAGRRTPESRGIAVAQG